MPKGLRATEEWLEEQTRRRTRWQSAAEVVNTDQRGMADAVAVVHTSADAANPSLQRPDVASGNAADVVGGLSSPAPHGASSGHLNRVLRFVLPLPPSVNFLYRPGERHGSLFLRDEQKQFRSECKAAVRRVGVDPMAGRVELRVLLYFKNRRVADIDNRLKAVLDGLQHGGAYIDDSQVDCLWVERIVRPGTAEECVVLAREIEA